MRLSGLVVDVSDPLMRGVGTSAYITYRVSVKTHALETRRRYGDFEWLHQQLTASFPGVLIPPLPDKALTGNFAAEFIQARISFQSFDQHIVFYI